jgi:hypothetical protein
VNGNTSGWNGFTFFNKIPAEKILNMAASWKFDLNIAVANATIANAVILKTAQGSASVISSTTVLFGGSATPTLTPGQTFSDSISLQLDDSHDFWIVVAFTSGSSASFTVPTWSLTDAGSPDPTGSVTHGDLIGGWHSGDQTGTNPIPTFAQTSQGAYGVSQVVST